MDRTGTGHADLHTSSSFAVNNIPTRELKIDPSKDLWTNISVNVREATAEVPDHHILVVGQKGAGKTSLLRRFSALDQCPDLSFSSSANSSQPKRGTRVGKPGSDAGFPSALALEYIPSCKMEPASTISSSSQQHTGGIPGHSLATATSSSSPAVAPTVHYWELGGGSDLSSLIDVVLTPETITTTSVMIVVDASAPDCIFSSSLSWLQRVHTRTAACFERMKSKGNSTPEKMLQRFFNKYGLSTHEDFAATMDAASASTFRICPLPLVLVVTKLDILFQKESDPTRMDFLLRALRYLAHTHCATLVCPPHITGGGDPRSTSHPMLSALEQTNALMAHVCLNVELPQKERFPRRSLEHDPIYVLFGQDSLKQIQAPTSDVQRGTSGISNVSTGPCSELLNRWKRLLLELYPPRDGHHGGGGETGEDSVATRISSIEAFLQAAYTQYAEPSIDAFRQQKDELMEQWRKGRAKKAAQAAAASGENV